MSMCSNFSTSSISDRCYYCPPASSSILVYLIKPPRGTILLGTAADIRSVEVSFVLWEGSRSVVVVVRLLSSSVSSPLSSARTGALHYIISRSEAISSADAELLVMVGVHEHISLQNEPLLRILSTSQAETRFLFTSVWIKATTTIQQNTTFSLEPLA